jgi:anti-sigma B factor antagonist
VNKGSSLAVVRLTGELDIGRRDEIAKALVLSGHESGILIDFAEVTYADSTTLTQLLRFRAEAEQLSIPLAIVIASRQFARLIQYAGLGEAFAIFDNLASALAYLNAAAAT